MSHEANVEKPDPNSQVFASLTPVTDLAATRSEVEGVKEASAHLRGTLAADLADPTSGTVGHDSHVLIKFHGIYAQDDRDQRRDRTRRKVELAHIFMVRASVPGGHLTADQW